MRLLLALAIVITVVPATIAAQVDGRTGAVTATLIAQARQMANGNASAAYDNAHPDLRNVLPRRAFALWLVQQPYATPTGDPVVDDVAFGDWTSNATGDVYPEAAIVSLTIPATVDGAQVEVSTTWGFAFDGYRWRWLPDISREYIEDWGGSIDDFPGGYQSAFRQSDYQEIDRFWQGEFFAANVPYVPPEIVPVTAPEVDTGCGTVKQVVRLGVFYCVYDGTIYFDPAFRDEVIEGTGPFGWVTVLAHEWGHHVQALVGVDSGGTAVDPIQLEVQADCLSAIVAQDAYARGEIGEVEVADAIAVIRLAGDIPGTDPADPAAHGSAAERVTWFERGFDRGFAGCDLALPPAA